MFLSNGESVSVISSDSRIKSLILFVQDQEKENRAAAAQQLRKVPYLLREHMLDEKS